MIREDLNHLSRDFIIGSCVILVSFSFHLSSRTIEATQTLYAFEIKTSAIQNPYKHVVLTGPLEHGIQTPSLYKVVRQWLNFNRQTFSCCYSLGIGTYSCHLSFPVFISCKNLKLQELRATGIIDLWPAVNYFLGLFYQIRVLHST